MRRLIALGLSALVTGNSLDESVSGIEKVITLLEDLKADIEDEGKEEHETYDEFACFCKDKTELKSDKIEDSEGVINELSADIQENSATRDSKRSQLEKRKKKDEEMKADLQEEVTRCEKEAARFEYNIADFEKALKSIEGAKDALTGSKKEGAALVKLHEVVKKTVAEADALSLISAKDGKTLHQFLQSPAFLQGTVDPNDSEYKFHSQPLIDLLDKIHKDYEDKKDEVEKDFEADQEKCGETKTALTDELEENHDKIEELEEDIDELTTKISDDREDLQAEEETLKEDSAYLKDLTERCAKSANEFDQRAAMRDGELKALTKALDIIKNKVKDWEDKDAEEDSELQLPHPVLRRVVTAPVSQPKQASVRKHAASFLQRLSSTNVQDRRQKAIEMLSKESGRLNSVVLTSLAMQLDRPDPFVKVKSMIQKLIERLLNEAKTEAAHKGFCDEAVGKAKHDRDYRYEDIEELHVRLGDLKSTKNRLKREIKDLKKDLEDLEEALAEANKLRDEEKAENIDTLLKAKKAVAAVKEAILVLRTFYHSAKHHDFQGAKPGEVMIALQDKDPSFNKGSYRGNQDGGDGVIKEMQELQENFEAKIKEVETDEKTAAAEHEEFSRTTKADIGGKETKLELDEQELKVTIQKLDASITDLDKQSTLLDMALKELDDIKPMCFSNGMSFKEREKKRDEEIAALKMAQCILDPNGKEEDCKKEED